MTPTKEVFMSHKEEEYKEKLRQLVSDVQGAPYPSTIENELYTIWYEHIQKIAVECFQMLNEDAPKEQEGIEKTLDNML